MNTEHGFFGPSGGKLYGAYHPASGAGDIAALICNPFGAEELNAHRGLRHLAKALAAAGVPTLRFDLAGCGNSEGEPLEGERLQAWVASVVVAANALKLRSGASRVVLLGLRLGAALACLAAAQRHDMAGLVLMAPVLNGRRYLRELRALQTATSAIASEAPGIEPLSPEVGGLESGGFQLNAATCQALLALDLTQAPMGSSPVAMLDRDDLPGHERVVRAWQAAGVTVAHAALPGLANWLDEPQRSVVPQAFIEAAVQAVLGWCGAGTPSQPEGQPLAQEVVMHSLWGPVRKRAVRLQLPRPLRGVLARPAQGAPHRIVLLLNAGAVHHIGPSGMYVPLARRLAAQGCAVLRLDLSGLGESVGLQSVQENRLYAPTAEADVMEAVRWLRSEVGPVPLHLVGLCAGGYHAFKAVVAGVRATSVCVLNPLTFFWHEGDALSNALPVHQVEYMAAQYYRRSLWSAAAWRKLLGGGVSLRFAWRVVSQHLGARLRKLSREARRAVGLKLHEDLASELCAVAAQGTRMHFVFSRSDPGFALLANLGGRSVEQLQRKGHLSTHFIEHADHTFTEAHARLELQDCLVGLLCGATHWNHSVKQLARA